MKKYITGYLLHLLSSAAIATVILATGSCQRADEFHTDSGMIWNTLYNITYKSSRSFSDSILHTFENVGRSVSVFDSLSVVSRVNSAIKEATVDSAFMSVYNMSVKVNLMSDGAFDPALSPIIAAWGFGKGHTASADTARIDSLRSFCNIRMTHARGLTIMKNDPRTSFNFSAIAKGYGCDRIGAMLLRNGVSDYLVEVGGEITAHGQSPRGSDWIISIDRPNPDNFRTDSQQIIAITNCGVATSGNYRNYLSGPQGNYGHTINPSTGRPAKTDILSATIVASTCMEADALATACMVLGSDKACLMARKYSLAAMFVLADHSVWMTDEFKQLCR